MMGVLISPAAAAFISSRPKAAAGLQQSWHLPRNGAYFH
jgi:hypothetical protein